MNKRDLQLLEKVFANDISSKMPFQSKSKEYLRLEDKGYVRRMSVILPGKFPVTVNGWTLTTLGNYTYCMSLKDKRYDK